MLVATAGKSGSGYSDPSPTVPVELSPPPSPEWRPPVSSGVHHPHDAPGLERRTPESPLVVRGSVRNWVLCHRCLSGGQKHRPSLGKLRAQVWSCLCLGGYTMEVEPYGSVGIKPKMTAQNL